MEEEECYCCGHFGEQTSSIVVVRSMFVIDEVVGVVLRTVPGGRWRALLMCLSVESLVEAKLFLGSILTRTTACRFPAPPAQTLGLVGG